MSQIEEAEVPSKDECVIAMLAHVLMIFSWFWAPLIIYFAKRDSRFVAFHALQALYWQLIAFCGGVVCFVAFIVVMITTTFASAGAQAPSQKLTPKDCRRILVMRLMGGWVLNMGMGRR